MKKIIITGVTLESIEFLKSAICSIFRHSGYTVEYDDKCITVTKQDAQGFEIVTVKDYTKDIDLSCDIVFTQVCDWKTIKPVTVSEQAGVLHRYYETIKWMRSNNFAYCMNDSSEQNKKSLANYDNLRSIILPLQFKFKIKLCEGVKPQTLIEELVPELKQLTKQDEQRLKDGSKD